MIKLLSIICQKEKLIRAHCKYANKEFSSWFHPLFIDAISKFLGTYVVELPFKETYLNSQTRNKCSSYKLISDERLIVP